MIKSFHVSVHPDSGIYLNMYNKSCTKKETMQCNEDLNDVTLNRDLRAPTLLIRHSAKKPFESTDQLVKESFMPSCLFSGLALTSTSLHFNSQSLYESRQVH